MAKAKGPTDSTHTLPSRRQADTDNNAHKMYTVAGRAIKCVHDMQLQHKRETAGQQIENTSNRQELSSTVLAEHGSALRDRVEQD
jgi:hypothetical protein